jgi:polysaccharide export outer membrane protein
MKLKPCSTSLKNLALFIIVINFLSCTTKKEILYFQNSSKSTFDSKIIDQKIESNDIISVKINSSNIEVSKIYNFDLIDVAAQQISAIQLKNYLVNNEGNITLPILGIIKVTDKTMNELEQFLSKKLIDEGHLKDPTVIVRILNSKVTILGEVKMPGTYTFTEKNLTLLQAIGLAGDLTINGKREDIILIRQENNIKTISHINITSTDWFESSNYYIKQNDVIVVNPNNAKIKSGGLIGNASTFIAIVSLLLTGLLLIKK